MKTRERHQSKKKIDAVKHEMIRYFAQSKKIQHGRQWESAQKAFRHEVKY